MSQGKKLVTVADAATGLLMKKAVDEKRWNTIKEGLLSCFHKFGNDALNEMQIKHGADSQEGVAFLVSQLAYTEQTTYDRDYAECQFHQLLPVTAEAGADAASVRYQVYDRVGQGKRINGASRDIPYADSSASTVEFGVVDGGIGYRYSQSELIQSARLLRPLPSERMAAAVEASEKHLNQVAMLGERTDVAGTASFNGLLNYPSVTTKTCGSTAGYTGNWGTSSTTVDSILADINKMCLDYWTASNYTLLPNVFGFDPTAFSVLSTRYNSLGTKTILQLVQEANMTTARTGEKVQIFPILQGATAGGSSKPRAVFYRNENRRLVYHVPMPLRFLAPQPEGLDISIPGWYRYAGLNVRYLYSVAYLDNAF
jgi:hypothetical protein